MMSHGMTGAEKGNPGLARAALQNRRIRGLVAGFACVTMAEWVLGTTVAVHAYYAGGAVAVGLVGFRFVPAALAGLWTTQLAEHARQRRILSATAAVRAAAAGIAVIALALGLPLAIVIAMVWLDAAAGSAYRPAQAALLPALARSPGELTAATAMLSNVKTSGQLVGALLGGLLVASVHVTIPVACAAALYALAIALTWAERRSIPLAARLIGLRALRIGVSTLRADREARVIVIYSCLRSFVRGLWLALAVVASIRLLSLGRSGFGLLMAAAAVGALAAIVPTARLLGNRRLADWFALGLLLCGLPIAVTGAFTSASLAVLMMVAWGVGMSLSDVGAQTLLNRIIPGSAIGQVTGAMAGGKLMCEGLGSLIAAALVIGIGTRSAVLVVGAVLPLGVAIGYSAFARIDDRAVARIDVLELLRGVPFFAPLAVAALEGVAARLQSERHLAGTVIVRQGDLDASRWYLVRWGELTVEVEGFLVGDLGRGSQFGERGLLRGVARAATVRAVTDVELYGLERDDFITAVSGIALDGQSLMDVHQLDPSTALARAPLLHSVEPTILNRLLERSRVQDVDAGTPIVTTGEVDDTYHVLLKGCAQVFVAGQLRQELFPGDAFGEIAVLHQVPRTATVTAREPSSILTVDGDAIRAAVRSRGGALARLTT
jgi:CRP-like cAMP-binding protein